MISTNAARVVHHLAGLDAHEVWPRLAVGAYPRLGDAVRAAGYDALVLCAHELQPDAAAYPGVVVLRCPLADDATRPLTQRELLAIADTATEVATRVTRGARVLVTCQAGRNRSALVAALALRRLTGVSGAQAAAHVRLLREAPSGPVLSNHVFLAYLRSLP